MERFISVTAVPTISPRNRHQKALYDIYIESLYKKVSIFKFLKNFDFLSENVFQKKTFFRNVSQMILFCIHLTQNFMLIPNL